MAKPTRKQKKRNQNDAVHHIRHLTDYYTTVVNSYFLFKDWIEAMMVEYTDPRYYRIMNAFIVQSMVYLQCFIAEHEGKTLIILDKDNFVTSVKDQNLYSNLTYTEDFTKESVMEFLDKCINKFFTNTIFEVKDSKEIEKKGEQNV